MQYHYVEVFEHMNFYKVNHTFGNTSERVDYHIPYYYLYGEFESYMQIEYEPWHETS
jgi:hypothetical protein